MRFPKMHIAESAVNRILNINDGIEAQAARVTPPPVVPNPALEGARIDAELSQPTPPLPGISDTPDPGALVTGTPLLDTLINPET